MVAGLGKSSSHRVLCGEKYGAVLLPKESLRSVVVGESMAESIMGLSNDSRSSKRAPGLRSMDSCEEGRRKSAYAIVVVLVCTWRMSPRLVGSGVRC